MKVLFHKNIKTYSGKDENAVYNSCMKDSLCVVRDFTYPKLTVNNTHLGAIGKNLAMLWRNADAAYHADFKTYSQRNGVENVPEAVWIPGSYALFVKMMFAFAKSDPTHIDLTAMTLADIITLDADVSSVERAVGAGYLPNISVYDDLTADIDI